MHHTYMYMYKRTFLSLCRGISSSSELLLSDSDDISWGGTGVVSDWVGCGSSVPAADDVGCPAGGTLVAGDGTGVDSDVVGTIPLGGDPSSMTNLSDGVL